MSRRSVRVTNNGELTADTLIRDNFDMFVVTQWRRRRRRISRLINDITQIARLFALVYPRRRYITHAIQRLGGLRNAVERAHVKFTEEKERVCGYREPRVRQSETKSEITKRLRRPHNETKPSDGDENSDERAKMSTNTRRYRARVYKGHANSHAKR